MKKTAKSRETKQKEGIAQTRKRDVPLGIDQIYEIKSKNLVIDKMLDHIYCLECDRIFSEEKGLEGHVRTKNHKRRLRYLKEKPHTQEDAEYMLGRPE